MRKQSLTICNVVMIMIMIMIMMDDGNDRFGGMIRSVGLCNIDCFKPTATAK